MKIVGFLMLAALFAGMFVFMGVDSGDWTVPLKAFGFALILVVWVLVAALLASGSLK